MAMIEQGPKRHELRWRIAFFVVGTLYVLFLLVDQIVRVFGGFAQIFITVFLAWLLAFVLAPAVGWVRERTGWPRGMVVGLVYAAALIISGGLLFYVGSNMGAQLGQFAHDFPATSQRIETALAGWQQGIGLGGSSLDLAQAFRDGVGQVGRLGSGILGVIAGVGLTVLGGLVVVLILSLYMVLDSDHIFGWLKRLVPDRFEDEADLLERSVARAFGGFLRAQLILAAIQAVLTIAIGLALSLPFLFLVTVLSAVAMLIPFFGPPLALLPPALAIAIYRPEWLLVGVPVLVLAQTVIVNYVQPRLMQGALGLHPLIVLIGLLVGAQVAGVWGALFAIPVIAVLTVFATYALNIATLHDTAEVEVEEVLEEARRQAPEAPKEELVALAADIAEVAHEDAREEAAEGSLAVSQGLQTATEELHAASVQAERAAGQMRDAAHDMLAAGSHVREWGEGADDPPAELPEAEVS